MLELVGQNLIIGLGSNLYFFLIQRHAQATAMHCEKKDSFRMVNPAGGMSLAIIAVFLAGMALDPGVFLESIFGAANFHFAGALGLKKSEFLLLRAANIFLRPGPVQKIFFHTGNSHVAGALDLEKSVSSQILVGHVFLQLDGVFWVLTSPLLALVLDLSSGLGVVNSSNFQKYAWLFLLICQQAF